MALAMGLAAPPVAAQTNTALAEDLFNKAFDLMDSGRYPRACRMLEESQRLDPAIGTQFRIAECYEKIGRVASARALFVEVADSAKKAGNAARERVARERAAALERVLPRLVIVVPDALKGGSLEVRRDGLLVEQKNWAKGVPVDFGSYSVIARMKGRTSWTKTVAVTEPTGVVTLIVPVLARDEPLPVSPPKAPAEPAPSGPSPVLVGVGVTLVVGVVALFATQSLHREGELFGGWPGSSPSACCAGGRRGDSALPGPQLTPLSGGNGVSAPRAGFLDGGLRVSF